MISGPKCEICREAVKKYKCPKCSILYCSLVCYKSHQGEMCSSRIENAAIAEVLQGNSHDRNTAQNNQRSNIDDQELDELGDRVSNELLDKLEENEKLKALLYNKHLREYLLELNNHKNPERAMENAMREPIFVEFANECLKVVEPETKEEVG